MGFKPFLIGESGNRRKYFKNMNSHNYQLTRIKSVKRGSSRNMAESKSQTLK